jgi:hypothetical protein
LRGTYSPKEWSARPPKRGNYTLMQPLAERGRQVCPTFAQGEPAGEGSLRCVSQWRMAGFGFSKIEPIAGSPSEQRLHWRARVRGKIGTGTETQADCCTSNRSLLGASPIFPLRVFRCQRRGRRHAGTGRQAHRALIRYSVPDFTLFVKPKSGPPGKMLSVVGWDSGGVRKARRERADSLTAEFSD